MSDVMLYKTNDLMTMAKAMGPLFQKKPDDLFALMLIAQAENKHPAIAAQEYDIIQGRPALRSQATLARFQAAGGKIQWIVRDDTKASAKFYHPAGGELTVTWTIERAKKAGLSEKDTWKKFTAQMLSSRVVAEGVRAVYPACLSGMYVTEEVQDIVDEPRNVTPEKPVPGQQAQDVQATVIDGEPKAPLKDPQKDPPEQTPEYVARRGEILKAVAAIVGAKDDPNAWTAQEKEPLEVKELAIESGKAGDIKPLEVLLLRAQIGAEVRGTPEWAKVMPAVIQAGHDLDSLKAILDTLVMPTADEAPEEPELEIYG